LDDATTATCLTSVLGFAGSGKTVLLSSWVAARPAERCAWLSCDDADADPVRFWTSFVAAIRRVEPSVGADTLDRIELDGTVHLDTIGVFTDELRRAEKPIVIVVDDLHDAAHEGLWPLLTAFVEWLPPAHRIVLASRREPSLPMHRWRVEGRVSEIRSDQLAFDEDEAAAMLIGLGVAVEHDTVWQLTRQTEGWAAGLQLAGLSLRDREDATAYLVDLATTDRNIADYLTDEVLDRQPADLTDFLLSTSVLRELEPRVCRALTGDADPQRRLREIEARGLFLVPLDRGRQRFRYHHLFAELLQGRLRATDEPRELQLHRLAADWYADEGDLDLAVFHAVRARDTEFAVSLMRGRVVRDYFAGAPIRTTRLIDLLADDTLRKERELALEFALVIGMNGALDEAGRWLRRLDRVSDALPDPTFEGRLAAAHAFWEMARGGAERAMEQTKRARTLLDPDEDIARELAVAESRVLHYLDDLEGVRRLAEARPSAGLPPMADVVVLGARAGIEADAGFLRIAEELGRAGLELAAESGTLQHFSVGEAMRVLAAVQVERLELDDAEAMLERALRMVERERPGIELLCLVERVWLLVERRRPDEALETVALAEALVDRVDPCAALVSRVTTTAARLHLLTGEPDRAVAAVSRTPPGTRRGLAEARLALAQDRPAEAERILGTVETGGWPRNDLEVALLRAQVDIAFGRSAKVVDPRIEQALDLAEEHGFVRSVLVDGPGLGEPLVRALRRAPEGSHRDRIGRRLRSRVPLPARSGQEAGRFSPSSRELEVLRYLATHLTNREIAAELYISVNTMKTHVRSLYQRLGVSSRSQAVAEGRARGLL
jgi:LuxR family maltose regulon positive regulatory protein